MNFSKFNIFYNDLIKNNNEIEKTNIYNLNYIEDNYMIIIIQTLILSIKI